MLGGGGCFLPCPQALRSVNSAPRDVNFLALFPSGREGGKLDIFHLLWLFVAFCFPLQVMACSTESISLFLSETFSPTHPQAPVLAQHNVELLSDDGGGGVGGGAPIIVITRHCTARRRTSTNERRFSCSSIIIIFVFIFVRIVEGGCRSSSPSPVSEKTAPPCGDATGRRRLRSRARRGSRRGSPFAALLRRQAPARNRGELRR